LKRLKGTSPKQWVNSLSSAYLEWVYGLKPTIADLEDAATAAERLWGEYRYDRKQIHAVGRETVSQTPTKILWSNNPAKIHFIGENQRYVHDKYVYQGIWKRETTGPNALSNIGRITSQFGLGLNEFVPTVWELLPWSFLADYFSNIGDVLEDNCTDTSTVAWVKRDLITDSVDSNFFQLNISETIKANTFGGTEGVYSIRPGVDGFYVVRRRYFIRDSEYPQAQTLAFELPGKPQKWLNMAMLWTNAVSVHPQRMRDPRKPFRR